MLRDPAGRVAGGGGHDVTWFFEFAFGDGRTEERGYVIERPLMLWDALAAAGELGGVEKITRKYGIG